MIQRHLSYGEGWEDKEQHREGEKADAFKDSSAQPKPASSAFRQKEKRKTFIIPVLNHQRFTVVSLVKCFLYNCNPWLWDCGDSGAMLVILNFCLKKKIHIPCALLNPLWLNISVSPTKNMQIIFFYTFLALQLKCHLYHWTISFSLFSNLSI